MCDILNNVKTRKHIVIDARIRKSSTGRYADRLLDHLQIIDSTNRYTVLISPDDQWQPKAENFSTRVCPYQQFSFNPLEQIGFAWQLYRLRADLVHFTMTQQPLLYFGKIVTTTHDLTMFRFTKPKDAPMLVFRLKILGYRLLFWAGHRKSKKIIVPTDFAAEDLIDYQPFTKDKIVRTYEASEPPLESRAAKPKGVKAPFILYVGTAFPHKNLEGLIDAFEQLKQDHPKLSLVLAGKREYHSNELEASIADRDIASSVLFTGFVSDSELKWLYQNASAYVFPSFSEGFGLPGLEAMAHSCPLVSSNATCLPEVYGAAAHYFDPSDTTDMAQKIHEVIADEKLRGQLIKRGHKQVKQYSWRRMAEETLDVYRSVLNQTK